MLLLALAEGGQGVLSQPVGATCDVCVNGCLCFVIFGYFLFGFGSVMHCKLPYLTRVFVFVFGLFFVSL